ncbi:hypothetical protein IRX26_004786 [Salmonella enterica]|nr:hypothetical protein [Salmonella enterica]
MKTTKAGTYNVWVALVPAGAAQPVSPVKTALVFLAGPPDATNTTVSTDRSAANADNKETITVTLTPRDSHNNVVPLWTFRKDLTIVPSVNATVPGAVTVTTPAQDTAGAVTATLTYVDTSGKLLSKEARAGTTTITIGKAVKQTVDTRFYPQVHVCASNLTASGFIVPGQTEVQICYLSDNVVPNGSGYTVTLPGMSSAGCTKSGGGVCPPDTAGEKADFTGLTGDDIAQLVFHPMVYNISDDVSHVGYKVRGPWGRLAYYGELATPFGRTTAAELWSGTQFHTDSAQHYCETSVHTYDPYTARATEEAVVTGETAGGPTSAAGELKSLYIGRVTGAVHTGDTVNPELFVLGATWHDDFLRNDVDNGDSEDDAVWTGNGALVPDVLVMVAGKSGRVATYAPRIDGLDRTWAGAEGGHETGRSFGRALVNATGWDLSGMYAVTSRPGKEGDTKPDKNDTTNRYVSHVNYVTGYICAAELP